MTVGLLPSPTDEQAMLVDASTRFIEAELPMSAVRKHADGAEHADTTYRRMAADLGWFGMLASDAVGGATVSGNGVLDAALIAAERGARLQPGPFAGHSVVVHALSTVRTSAHDAVLAELVQGRRWATWAFGAHDSCALRPFGDALRLDGRLEILAGAGDCGWLFVGARAPQGLAQVLLPIDAPGVVLRRIEGLDVTRSWWAIELENVRVKSDDFVGEPGAATEALVARQTQLAGVLSAAEAVGAMHADFALALQYAKDRIAFGRPIGSFQAIKHLLADTSLWLEMSKAIVAAAAAALGSGAPDGPELAHAAKAFVSERSVELAHNCFQVFGGIGYTWEHDQHFYLRRLAADAASFGSAAWHREQLLQAAGVSR